MDAGAAPLQRLRPHIAYAHAPPSSDSPPPLRRSAHRSNADRPDLHQLSTEPARAPTSEPPLCPSIVVPGVAPVPPPSTSPGTASSLRRTLPEVTTYPAIPP